MARVIDTRSTGSELVVLGDRLVLPSSDGASVGAVPPGSLRRNSADQTIEFYTTATTTTPGWQPLVTVPAGDDRYLQQSGGTIVGELLVTSTLTVDDDVVVTGGMTVDGNVTAAFFDGPGADLAERYTADFDEYEPGTVMVLGGTAEVTVSTGSCDKAVAGVITTNPAYVMNSLLDGEMTVALALRGRVPCKVVGMIRRGDLLTTSEYAGHAMKAPDDCHHSAIIGKAIEDFDGVAGVMEILV